MLEGVNDSVLSCAKRGYIENTLYGKGTITITVTNMFNDPIMV